MKTPIIHCAYDELVPLDKLVPHPRNVNTHPPEQVKLLAELIKRHGWRHPLVVSKRSGFIVAGHGRLLAARQAKLKNVPVNYQHFETEVEEIAFLVSDNRLAELAEFDDPELAKLMKEFAINPASLGFDDDYYDKILEDIKNAPELLADSIAEIEEVTPTAEAARTAEKIRERIDALLEKMPSAFTGKAVILSDCTNKAIIISDPSLSDFLDELQRYAAAGDPSPLQAILERVHPL